jgi:hypothetical protein
MIEFPTADNMPDRFFLGEMIYCYLIQERGTEWHAKLLSGSKYLKPLAANDLLIGTRSGGFNMVTGLLREGNRERPPVVSEVPKSDSGAFFLSKKDSKEPLRTATLFCANPICFYPFAMTHTQWLKRSQENDQKAASMGDGFKARGTIECPKCGTCRVVNEDSFRGMVLL